MSNKQTPPPPRRLHLRHLNGGAPLSCPKCGTILLPPFDDPFSIYALSSLSPSGTGPSVTTNPDIWANAAWNCQRVPPPSPARVMRPLAVEGERLKAGEPSP